MRQVIMPFVLESSDEEEEEEEETEEVAPAPTLATGALHCPSVLHCSTGVRIIGGTALVTSIFTTINYNRGIH